MSPITSTIIRNTLRSCSKSSSPGDDQISYYHLWHLPSTHAFLAILFNRILFDSSSCPSIWCSGKIILIYKKGNPNDPCILLSSHCTYTWTIGELFHKILARRLEKYCLANNIIDPSIQKGFLHNVSGIFEHIASLTSILNQAKDLSMLVNITFLDHKNAFGSIQHDLVMSMLQTLNVPDPIVAYLNCYSQLVGHIHTNDWNTPPFQIQQGAFQGDTLSPIIFLLLARFSILSLIYHIKDTHFYAHFLTQEVSLPEACSHSIQEKETIKLSKEMKVREHTVRVHMRAREDQSEKLLANCMADTAA